MQRAGNRLLGQGLAKWGRCFTLLLLMTGFLSSCSSQAPEPVTFTGIAFYSMPWQVKVSRVPQGVSQTALHAELQQTLDSLNKVLSTYQPDTELMRFNATKQGLPFVASPTLFQAVLTARQVSQATQGVYDVTVGPLVNLWGFGPQSVPKHLPQAGEIDSARQRVGWQYLVVEPETVSLIRNADIQVDLSSLGEGMGVDVLVRVLEKYGIKDYMVSVAGTIQVKGRKLSGDRWQIAIEKPDGSGLPQQRLKLDGRVSVSTSGSYRNYHEIDGVRFSHTIDPRTGRPITHKGISVSVVLPDEQAALADAWATALNVLGPEEGIQVANNAGIPAYYMRKTPSGFDEKFTPTFKAYLQGSTP